VPDSRQSREEVFLSVIIPAHNEEHRIVQSLEKVSAFLDAQPYSSETLVVENGSSDQTAKVASEFAARRAGVRVMQEARRGKGLAVRRGMLAARGKYRFMCDVDWSMPVEEIAKFLTPAVEAADVAIGSREAKGSVVTDPFRRRFIGRSFNAAVRLLVLPGLRDTQCGFKCFTAEAAEFLFSRQRITGLAFDVEVLYIARRHGYRIVEVPIVWRYDPDSRVRMGSDPLRMVAELLAIRLNARKGLYD